MNVYRFGSSGLQRFVKTEQCMYNVCIERGRERERASTKDTFMYNCV